MCRGSIEAVWRPRLTASSTLAVILPPRKGACAHRNRQRASLNAVADGALGFWQAIEEVWPTNPRPALLGSQDRQCAEQSSMPPRARKWPRCRRGQFLPELKFIGVRKEPLFSFRYQDNSGLGESFRPLSSPHLSIVCVPRVFPGSHLRCGRPDCVAGHEGLEVRRETGKE
jgi:hypothetical protein